VSITYLQAEDEIYGIANRAWVSSIDGSGLHYQPKLYFPDSPVPPADVDEIYARCSFSVVTAEQASLSRYQGVSTYEEDGLFAMQIYAPKKKASALRTAKQMADVVRNAFCTPSTSGEVWFRGQRVSPVAGNETKNQVNVVITCTYRTTK
jgi:hypothetical protein